MIPLKQALQATAWRLLKIIGRRRGLHYPSNIAKAPLIERLLPRLRDPDDLAATLAGLDPDPARCLLDLRRAGGHLPEPLLTRRYGPWRATRALLAAHRRQTGLSPLEILHLSGLIFRNKTLTPPTIFIPTDLPAVSRPSSVVGRPSSVVRRPSSVVGRPSSVVSGSSSGATDNEQQTTDKEQRTTAKPNLPISPSPHPPISPSPNLPPFHYLCHDLTLLLALLHTQTIRPLHGRQSGLAVPPPFFDGPTVVIISAPLKAGLATAGADIRLGQGG